MKLERRFTKGADVRAKGTDDKPAIEGYAAVFNEDYVLYEDSGCRFVESIKPGAFSRVLEEKQDTRCLFNHQPDNVLGRTTNKTLRMVQDRQGLSYDNDLDIRTSIAQNVRCFVQRGDVTGCSFAFRVSKQSWREEEQDGGKMTVYTRVIEEIGELYDVGPVTYPAYEGTSVGARGAGALARELRSALWAEGIPAEIREKIRAKIQARADVVTQARAALAHKARAHADRTKPAEDRDPADHIKKLQQGPFGKGLYQQAIEALEDSHFGHRGRQPAGSRRGGRGA